MGVVFGDLSTSPIYSFRVAFSGLDATPENVYGVLSMIIYSLLVVVSCKYLFLLCYVESSSGSGGTLALVSRLQEHHPANTKLSKLLLVPVSIVAISLFLADSVITPGVSVLSSVEGLESLWPSIAPFTPFIAISLLLMLFFVQRYGTGKIGGIFGPVMLGYCIMIGSFGLATIAIVGEWKVFRALNPFYCFYFVYKTPLNAWYALQSVILAITGGEALYADMGHFGRLPIQFAWHCIVLPCLILCYLGQGAILLDPMTPTELASNPFFALAPTWWSRILLIFFSAAATLIGSQAVISGVIPFLSCAFLSHSSKGHSLVWNRPCY